MSNKRDTLISKVFKRYLIDAMGAMAYGLFASLIIGTIIGQFATFPGLEFLANIATVLKNSMVYGAAIGAAVAWGLKSDPLVMFSAAGAGAIGCVAGGPLGAFLAAVVGAELGQMVSKKTPVDIVVTPLVTVITGGLVGQFTGPYITDFMKWLGADSVSGGGQLHHGGLLGQCRLCGRRGADRAVHSGLAAVPLPEPWRPGPADF